MAGERMKKVAHGKHSCKRFDTSAQLVWLSWFPKVSISTQTLLQRWFSKILIQKIEFFINFLQINRLAEILMYGGSCMTVACWCSCHSCWNNTAPGKTAKCASLPLHKWKTIPFKSKRTWRSSSIIYVLKLRLKLLKWWVWYLFLFWVHCSVTTSIHPWPNFFSRENGFLR